MADTDRPINIAKALGIIIPGVDRVDVVDLSIGFDQHAVEEQPPVDIGDGDSHQFKKGRRVVDNFNLGVARCDKVTTALQLIGPYINDPGLSPDRADSHGQHALLRVDSRYGAVRRCDLFPQSRGIQFQLNPVNLALVETLQGGVGVAKFGQHVFSLLKLLNHFAFDIFQTGGKCNPQIRGRFNRSSHGIPTGQRQRLVAREARFNNPIHIDNTMGFGQLLAFELFITAATE